ncbi:unnamed protein product, partial [Ectocarpus sp. 12 AP-2014]
MGSHPQTRANHATPCQALLVRIGSVTSGPEGVCFCCPCPALSGTKNEKTNVRKCSCGALLLLLKSFSLLKRHAHTKDHTQKPPQSLPPLPLPLHRLPPMGLRRLSQTMLHWTLAAMVMCSSRPPHK